VSCTPATHRTHSLERYKDWSAGVAATAPHLSARDPSSSPWALPSNSHSLGERNLDYPATKHLDNHTLSSKGQPQHGNHTEAAQEQ